MTFTHLKMLRYRFFIVVILAALQGCAINVPPSGQIPAIQQRDSALGSGVLRVSPTNPRYFTDASGRAIYLTGSHTWTGLIDRGPSDPPAPFDFNRYLNFLHSSNHNFIRLWSRHVTRYESYGSDVLYGEPLPWVRSGPGMALDGKPRFDLTRFNDRYFSRLRNRVIAAGEIGIYVGIMLFGGQVEVSEWAGNPFNPANNVNGINGDIDGDGKGDTQILPLPSGVEPIQRAYVRRVVDTVNDLDNVLFEISNEGELSSIAWQYQLIEYLREYESGRTEGVARKQHPVGMTGLWSTDNTALLRSTADWISPGAMLFDRPQQDPYLSDPPVADGSKVSILDSDHLFLNVMLEDEKASRSWVWKSFLRGHNPILMDNIFEDSTGRAVPPTLHRRGFVAARAAMGDTRRYADKINLAAMMPRTDLSSTGYALINPGSEYLVYQPHDGPFTVSVEPGTYNYEWFDPASGKIYSDGSVPAVDRYLSFSAPFKGDAVLYLKNSTIRSLER
jgi:hypothetical protein